jgi:hypothetical protein
LNGLPITSGLYYYWHDVNGDHHVDPNEIDFDAGIVSYYQVNPFVAPTPANAISPDFKTPTTDEVTFGLDHQLFSDFAVSATYTYRHVKDFQFPGATRLDSGHLVSPGDCLRGRRRRTTVSRSTSTSPSIS